MAGEKNTLPYRFGQLERALNGVRYWMEADSPVARPYCRQRSEQAVWYAAAIAWLYRGALGEAREG